MLEFVGDLGEDGLLRRSKFKDDGHQKALAFDFLRGTLFQDAFKQDALVGDVLVDDPESVFVYGEDERVTDLSQRTQRRERGQRGIFFGCGVCVERRRAAVVGNYFWNRIGEAGVHSASHGNSRIGLDGDSTFELKARRNWRRDRRLQCESRAACGIIECARRFACGEVGGRLPFTGARC